MLTWIKDFDKFEARFRQFGGWLAKTEHAHPIQAVQSTHF